MPYRADNNFTGSYNWQISDHVCALSDGERHIGHTVRIAGRWHAFDATHTNPAKDGFLFMGVFLTAEAAMSAIEHGYLVDSLPIAGAA